MCDFSKNSLSKVLQNFLSLFKMSQVLVKFKRNLMQILVKFWEKRIFSKIFVNFQRKSDENFNMTLEIFCDFEKISSKL